MNIGWTPKSFQEKSYYLKVQIFIWTFGGALLVGSLIYNKVITSLILLSVLGGLAAGLIFLILAIIVYRLSSKL